VAVFTSPVIAQSFGPATLRGIVVDDANAELTGSWMKSSSVRPFVGEGYIHDENTEKGSKSVRFTLKVPADGDYEVLLSYSHGSNRDKKVPVEIHAADGVKTVHIDQSVPAALGNGFQPLGQFRFEKDKPVAIVISNRDTQQHVIADAVQVVTPDEFKLVQADAKTKPVVKKPPAPPAKKNEVAKSPPPEPPKFNPIPPSRAVASLTPPQLDDLLEAKADGMADVPQTSGEEFLRRASLDLIGRQPTRDELLAFVADESSDKRSVAIERLLASEDYGHNWANYWSDVIGSRQQEPELTFHDYKPFKKWLADEFNAGASWDEITFRMLTARGKVGQNPEATFIGFHQGDANRLAGETTRVFLSVKIACAECHDHPFVDMPQETFHGMAAFFARTEAKIAQLDSNGIEVKSKTKGEQKIPGKKGEMPPTPLAGDALELGADDLVRRAVLAHWITSGDNPYFARAYVNRIWSRLMGRGFADPVDDFGEDTLFVLPEVHQAVADHFIASGFNHREMCRLVMNTRAYGRALTESASSDSDSLAAVNTKPLRGDEVFDSLVAAIGLENITPPRENKTGAVRFPPPPKSTRDLVNAAFGYDPSFPDKLVLRSMKQAMFMMNNQQLGAAIDTAPETETFLAKLIAEEGDDEQAIVRLYQHVLARNPTDKELKIVLAHVEEVNDRPAAFEDILWSLLNSAEFTTRK
jgi:hypothetical protein